MIRAAAYRVIRRAYTSAADAAASTLQSTASTSATASATAAATAAAASAPKVASFVKAGTKLKGCNVRKNGTDPIAKEDHEYPAWLWDLLDPAAQQAKLDADPVLAARKARRLANRTQIKEHNFLNKGKS